MISVSRENVGDKICMYLKDLNILVRSSLLYMLFFLVVVMKIEGNIELKCKGGS